ncbi:MAG: hypothetical protein ACH344_08820 [Yersinia sp. (in: enterobacteria)]
MTQRNSLHVVTQEILLPAAEPKNKDAIAAQRKRQSHTSSEREVP